MLIYMHQITSIILLHSFLVNSIVLKIAKRKVRAVISDPVISGLVTSGCRTDLIALSIIDNLGNSRKGGDSKKYPPITRTQQHPPNSRKRDLGLHTWAYSCYVCSTAFSPRA